MKIFLLALLFCLPALAELPGHINSREMQKFVETSGGDVALRVLVDAASLPTGAATAAKQDEQTNELIVINGHLLTISGYLDGVETKLDAGNASLASIDADFNVALSTRASEATLVSFQSASHTDLLGVQAKQDSQTTELAAINASTDGIEALLTAGNASLASIDSDFNVQLSTRASESTLSSFQGANHSDLLSIISHLTTVEGYTDGLEGKLDIVSSALGVIQGKQDLQTTQLNAINANTDGLETLVGSTNTKLDTANTHLVNLEGYVDQVESFIDGIETLIGTTNTSIGATNETAAATDTSTSGLNGLLKRIAQRLTSLIAFYASDYGASSGAIRVASQIGNTTGAANFGAGTTGAQTLRTASNLYDGSANAITSEAYSASRALHVKNIFEGPASSTLTTIVLTTGNVAQQLLPANALRKGFLFINSSGANITIGFGYTPVAGTGLVISNSSNYPLDSRFNFLGTINAVSPSNNRTVSIIEFF